MPHEASESELDDGLPEFPWKATIAPEQAGRRLDAFLAEQLSYFSRAVLKKSISAGHVTVDGQKPKASLKLAAEQTVIVAAVDTPSEGPEPEAIDLDLLYEDDDLVAVNKPAGMIVHPAKGHWNGTLASALAYHFGQLSTTGGTARPGIVHRLDRDTSGVIVVAKHNKAHEALADQFKQRTTQKEYLALLQGVPDRDADIIDQPIGPHPHIREQMAIRHGHEASRDALTRYEVIERFRRFTLVKALPKTGRTHQIRVHFAHVGYPVLCDKLYGGRSQITPAELRGELPAGEPLLTRQALHAHRLALVHPRTGEPLQFEAPIPADIERVLSDLRSHT